MAEDFYFAYPLKEMARSKFIDDVTSGDVKVEHLSRENANVRVWGDAAVLTGKDSARWFYKGHDYSGHYKVMHVYSLRNESGNLFRSRPAQSPDAHQLNMYDKRSTPYLRGN